MNKPVKVLIVEDSEDDAKLALRALRRGGFEPTYRRVQTAAELETALAQERWDAVLLDFKMPGFTGMDALRICRSTGLDIPFILISGTIGEEIAVEAMKAGASDYIMKKSLARLAPALERELKETQMRAGHRQAQCDLIESEERFRSLTALSSDWYWEQDENFRFTQVPPGLKGKFGDVVEGWIGKTRWELPYRDADWIEHRATLEARKPFRDVELQPMKHDGSFVNVSISGEPKFDGDGHFLGYRGVGKDITERVRHIDDLRRLRAAIDATTDAIYLVDRTSMHFIYVNDAACRMLNQTREELLALGPERVLSTSRAELEHIYDSIIAGGAGTEPLEMLRPRKDGSQVWVELRRHATRSGASWMIVSLVRDITKRKRAEQALVRLVSIIEATPDMVATGDPNGHVLYYNRAGLRMLGFEPGLDLSTVRFLDTHPEWAAKLVMEKGIPHAIEHGTWSGETALLRRDGREIPISQVIIAHKGSDGSVEYLSTIARDMTLRKEHEKRITRLNRVYAVLSGINMTIVRTRDRQDLFNEACRIAVELGKFRLAWIGLLDANGLDVTPVARAGVDEGYLDNIQLTARDDAPDRCEMVARALREKTAVVCNDVDTDPQMARWREEALRRGYRSVAVFPLQLEDKVMGLLLLYASDAGFFDMEEMRLLTEIAGDISFALDHLEKEARLDYLAYYDSLTGLANRTLFLERLEEHVVEARNSRSAVALLLMNIDRFKMINDALGRAVGDELLRQLARRVISVTNEPGCIARIGGDVFAVMMFNFKSAEVIARRTEQRIEEIFGAPFEIGGAELRVSARFGIAVFPDDGGDAETLFKNAEAALKKARASGERYLFYTQKMSRKVAETLALENKLRQALKKEQFVLHYQPKVDLETRNIVGVEALIRWMSPEHGLVPPLKFIPLLEETGFILEVGAWALRQAAQDHRHWVEQGLSAPRVAVNVSPVQLRRSDFIASLEEAIRQGASPHGLDLEITESVIMEDIEGSIGKLRAARDLGIGIAIDDFGTGYSSLAYLAKLPVETLKIDRSFIITMLKEPDVMLLVQTMISLAQSLRLKVVAEGVDEEEQAKMLRLLRCDQMQGYLFSRPIPREEITPMLKPAKKI